MKDFYKTLSKPSSGILKDRGSRFLSFAFPIKDRADIKSHLNSLQTKFHDARHHCYAYVLDEEVRANDDGEPNHSAGDSILRSITSRELDRVLVVVIRYFGGTKLGIRGLINAYHGAANAALEDSEIITISIVLHFNLTFSYDKTNDIMQLMDRYQAVIVEQSFKEVCKINGEVPVKLTMEFKNRLKELLAQKILLSFDISSTE